MSQNSTYNNDYIYLKNTTTGDGHTRGKIRVQSHRREFVQIHEFGEFVKNKKS
jgi:hypothetical protein